MLNSLDRAISTIQYTYSVRTFYNPVLTDFLVNSQFIHCKELFTFNKLTLVFNKLKN